MYLETKSGVLQLKYMSSLLLEWSNIIDYVTSIKFYGFPDLNLLSVILAYIQSPLFLFFNKNNY
jgi:hypothetical protein